MARAGQRRKWAIRRGVTVLACTSLLVATGVNAYATGPDSQPAYATSPDLGDAKGRADQANGIAKHLQERGVTGVPVKHRQQPDLAAGIELKQTQKDCIAYDADAAAALAPNVPPPYDCGDVPEAIMDGFKGLMFPQGEALEYVKKGERAIYPFKDDARTLVVQNEGHSDRFMAIFENNNKATPTYMDFRVDLPKGYYLATDVEDSNRPVFRYTNPKDRSISYDVGGMAAPWATDSNDRSVTAGWEYIDKNTIRLNVEGKKTVDGKEIAYPITADPWLSVGWDWWPPSPVWEVHLSADETAYLYDSLWFIDAFVGAMCTTLSLIPPPPGLVLAIACGFIASYYIYTWTDFLTEAAESGCGSKVTFTTSAYPDSWEIEC